TCTFLFLDATAPDDIYTCPTRRSSDLEDVEVVVIDHGGRAHEPGILDAGRIDTLLGAKDVGLLLGLTNEQDAFRLFKRSQAFSRSEEHTSELQSRVELVCRLLLEKKSL